jgi:glycosyltransferase involved in cell wall biosynthesis
VTFAGVQWDVKPWLAMMDVFVLPSTNVETFSNAALEAMAMQKPVILSRLGGADEMIRNGVDGYVVDIGALSEALPPLLHTLHEDRMLRERLARSARERVEQRFSMEAMLERFSELIDPKLKDAETL